ncbi:MAG: hypothetical protein HYW95_00715 [Candidatus Wildermuthbacteria bacterium]|nr:hypothetical protein [Candidatus Wildermuthbacteria bacterium]
MIKRIKEKERAVELRKQGLSYREILAKIPVSKSTLSVWLKSVHLSKKQKQRLTEKKLAAALRGARTLHLKRLQKWQQIKHTTASNIKFLTKRERWLIGVALYWAEGSKEKEYGRSTPVKFSNSDCTMIKFFQSWIQEFFKIPKGKLIYELYIHENATWKEAIVWWGRQLHIKSKYIRVYFKRPNFQPHRKNIGETYHGLIRIKVSASSDLTRKISGWVEGIGLQSES